MEMVAWIGLALLSLLATREWLGRRVGRPRHREAFDGVLYRVGEAVVAERTAPQPPRATVVCMHGFLENMHYFTEHYAATDVQLILINSADYHVPVSGPHLAEAPWAIAPSAPGGAIAYDADVLTQALEHLPRSGQVRIHGHSRGAAVVLEAARRRPERFRDVEVILEAPVLPGARARVEPPALILWLLPFLMPLWRLKPINPQNRGIWGPLDDPRKLRLIEAYPSNPRRVQTVVSNLRDLSRWMSENDSDLYRNIARGTVLVPGNDKVLDPASMRASARQAGEHLRVVELPGCSHFVVPDQPDSIPPLPGGGTGKHKQP